MKQEQVNHPAHYNQHPAGIECIDIIRHYTCDIANALKYLWRAGLKAELGKDDADKEIEDLKKALWYIEDFKDNFDSNPCILKTRKEVMQIVKNTTGSLPSQISVGYEKNIRTAIEKLTCVGILNIGYVYSVAYYLEYLDRAVKCIQQRIFKIEKMVLDNWRDRLSADDYDPLNIIIIQGRAYCLTDDIRKKVNGAFFTPCDNCALREECLSIDGSQPMKNLCGTLHYANDQQYYREVGSVKYAPSFGTIEVMDDHKELEKNLKELEEED